MVFTGVYTGLRGDRDRDRSSLLEAEGRPPAPDEEDMVIEEDRERTTVMD